MNHLLIAQTLADRADIPREGLTDVATATGETGFVVQWSRDALLDIQTQDRLKWKFLHTEFTKQTKASATLNIDVAVDNGGGLVGLPSTAHTFVTADSVVIVGTTNYDGTYSLDATTSANQIVITATYVAETFLGSEQAFIKDFEFYVIDGVQSFDTETFCYYKKSDGANFKTPLRYLEYSEFMQRATDYSTTSDPYLITITPTKRLRIFPAPNDIFVLCADGFLKPQAMAVSADIPILPDNFHMMIVWKGLMDYAGFEESSAIFRFAAIRYDELNAELIWQERYERSDDKVMRIV